MGSNGGLASIMGSFLGKVAQDATVLPSRLPGGEGLVAALAAIGEDRAGVVNVGGIGLGSDGGAHGDVRHVRPRPS